MTFHLSIERQYLSQQLLQKQRQTKKKGLPCRLHATVIKPGSQNRDFSFSLRKPFLKKVWYKSYLSSPNCVNRKWYGKAILIITTFISVKSAGVHTYKCKSNKAHPLFQFFTRYKWLIWNHLLIAPLDTSTSVQVLCSKTPVHNQAVFWHITLHKHIWWHVQWHKIFSIAFQTVFEKVMHTYMYMGICICTYRETSSTGKCLDKQWQ